MKIKICGLKRKEDIDYVNQSMPDWIGFVFAESRRQIDYETAKTLKQYLYPQIMAAGVFVNADISFIVRLAAEGILDMIQLHGDEDERYILELRSRLSEYGKEYIPVIKAVRVRTKEEIEEADDLPVDYLLLDAFKEDVYGGNGRMFDHKLIPQLKKPFILAGGIAEKNVTSILKELKKDDRLPVCVDVSSSVESNGYKDQEKIEKVIRRLREWNYM